VSAERATGRGARRQIFGTAAGLACADIPWPPAKNGRKKLRVVLLRHYPEKFSRIIGAVRETECATVMARVQALTQRISQRIFSASQD